MDDTEELKNVTRIDRDWTQGNIFKNLLSLSWPMIVNEALWGVGSIIDMIWVGRLGSDSIAGVGIAAIFVMLLFSLVFGLYTGATALISRAFGARDYEGANHAARQTYVLGGGFTLAVSVLGIILAEPLMIVFGLELEVVSEGAAYLRVQLAGSILMTLWVTGEIIMYASGDGKTPMKISLVARFFQLIFSPLLILGWGFFPRLGVSGAALGNLIAWGIGTILAFYVLFRGKTRLTLTFKNFRLDPPLIWRIIRIGFFSSINGIQRSLGNLAFAWLIAPFGTIPVAAHTLCQRVESFLFMPGMGLGASAGVLVGQNLGAGHPDRAEKSGWLAAAIVTGVMVVGGLALLIWAEGIVSIFTKEPDLIGTTSTFLRIAVTGYLALGFNNVLAQSISSAGDTLPPMVFNIGMMWLIQLPLAWALPEFTGLDVMGVRWAIVIGLYAAGAAFIIYFKFGRWKQKKV